MHCINLKHVHLTSVLTGMIKEVPTHFVETLVVMTQSLPDIETLDLSNNFFGDITIEELLNEVFPELKKLKNIDISANKITDIGL